MSSCRWFAITRTLPLLFYVLFCLCPEGRCDGYDEAPSPEAVFDIEELAVKQVKAAWDLTNIDPGENVTMSISEFWRQLKGVLQTIHIELKKYDRRILNNRPSTLMNKVLDLQDLSTLRTLSDSNSKNPFIKWRVKWIELSSMASHIHRLYNKRLRDIMNDEPYIKTVAQSIQKYMGYPWYSKLSGNIDENYRFLMRHFPQWIEQRMLSVIEGDLFVGLRRLIDENPTAKSTSAMESGDCKGLQTIGRIVPSSLQGPVFVLIYMALVDIKYYILINFYYIYLWVYESIPFFKHESLAEEMKERLEKKVEMYADAFRGFGKPSPNMPAPVEPGYFRCDPPQIVPDIPTRSHVYKFTFFKVTNFLRIFIAPEKSFRASGTCKGSCDLIDGTRAPCNETDADCVVDFEDECVKNPKACEGFKPPCPVEDTVCIDSSITGSFCPSRKRDRMLEWAKMGDRTFGEIGNCSQDVVSHKGSWVMESEPVADTPTMCEVCMCHCYSPIGDDLSSVRSFSLKAALASTADNKVVVGIKFEQVRDQIHLMIAEAKALPDKKVDMSTLVWRKPKPAQTDADPPQLMKLRRNLRIVHLDDLVAPPGYVVTGVRFVQGRYEGVYLHEYIGIQIQVHKIDENTGELDPNSETWIENNNSTISREPYNYVDPDDPVKGDGPALPDSSSNQFISFRATSISKDLGQNTVPYFDAQRVILEESSWLRGIGIFHKARPRFGGFLALKIITYNDT